MPSFVPPDRCVRERLEDGTPLFVLALSDDAESVLELRPEPMNSRLDGWLLLAMGAVTVMDGPDDLGFLIPSDPGNADAVEWSHLAADLGRAVVMLVNGDSLEGVDVRALVDSPGRGGVVRVIGGGQSDPR